ncbi:MAG: hypothetical protein Q4D41_05475 [Prevotellaceae bacterium]|nr:hypothetical protein [Prevotellaceae bacterium]
MKKIILAMILFVAGISPACAATDADNDGDKVVTNSFWDNWFVQAGLDMSLQNPYGKSFSNVFPKGKSFGLNVAIGKWFSPEIGLRGKINWENGFSLFENGHVEWIAKGDYDTNMDGGGYFVLSCDVLLNLHSIICGYDENRKWNIYVFPRAGLTSNRATKSGSPMVGAGWGCTYKLKERWSLYADMAYQVTTSEFYSGVSGTGMSVATGCNGFFDFNIGVQFNLGKNGGDKFNRVSSY